jgi:hypothetical protein
MKIPKPSIVSFVSVGFVVTTGHIAVLEFIDAMTPDCRIRVEICAEKATVPPHVPHATDSATVISIST